MSSNLQQDAQKVIVALKVTRNASQVGSAVTSVMIIWIIAFSKAQEFLPPWGAGLLALFIVALALGVMELGLRIFLPFALDEILAGRAWNEEGKIKSAYRISFWIFCLALCAALAFGTGGTSWLGRIDMIEAASPPPQVADLNQVRVDQDAERSRIYDKYEGEIQHARNSHLQRIKNAQATAKKLLDDAKHSKGTKMYQLLQSGNDWAAHQLSAAIQKAQKEGNALIEAEKEKVKQLSSEQATTLSALSAGQQEVFGKISQQAESTISRFDSKFERNTFMLGVFGVGCLGLFILTNILLSIYRVLSDVPTFEEQPERRKIKLSTNWIPEIKMGKSSHAPSPTAQARPIGFGAKEDGSAINPEADGGNFSGKATTPTTASKEDQSGSFSPEEVDKSGSFSPNVTTSEESYHGADSGNFSDNLLANRVEVKVRDIPDNTSKPYKKRRDVRARERLLATAFFTYRDENDGDPPSMRTLSNITGVGYKTTREIAQRLGLK